MKIEQKIALALALIGGVTQMNNKNKVESRNIKSRDIKFTNKFFEILKKDYDNGNKYGIELRDQIRENGIKLSDDYGIDRIYIFLKILEKETDKDFIKYLDSVIRRSRNYLGYYMNTNLEHIIFMEIDKIAENDNSSSGPMQKENDYNGNITAALEIIANDYNDKKVIYNKLIKGQSDIKSRKSNLEAINEVKNALVNIDNEYKLSSLDRKLEAIVKALEKIGYYDQE